MGFDICPACDGSKFRNMFEGTKCYRCDGTGFLEDTDPLDSDFDFEEYDPDYVHPEEQKRNDAMGRGDEMRDRAKDERGNQ